MIMIVFFKKPFLLAVALALCGIISTINADVSLGGMDKMGLWDVLQHLPHDYPIEEPKHDYDNIPPVQNSNDTNCDNQQDSGAVDSRREAILERGLEKEQSYNSENDAPIVSGKSILSQRVWQPISLDNFIKELREKLKSPEYRAKLEYARNVITNEIDNNRWSVFGTDKLEKQAYFIEAMQYYAIPNLLKIIEHGEVADACWAFTELKKLWPWKHEHSFLIDTYTNQEK